jgi:hypothetical protein
MPKKARTVEEKLKVQHTVDPDTGCWNWTGPLRNGYGQVCTARSKHVLAHRAAYQLFVGEITDGLYVCHRCDNRRCMNPEHLFLGTALDNAQDMVSKGRQASGVKLATKLTADQARAIREDGRKYREIAPDYGITFAMVGHIKRGRAWGSVSSL